VLQEIHIQGAAVRLPRRASKWVAFDESPPRRGTDIFVAPLKGERKRTYS